VVSQGQPEAVSGRPGAVLLVPGYGGSTASLDDLATRIRRTGRTGPVTVIGYSAGGVVAWLWDVDCGGGSRVGAPSLP
jgi:pimeloyl-ACP methyl ester carboxylesterase